MELFRSWLLLLYFDCIMQFRGFSGVHDRVRRQELRPRRGHVNDNELSYAVDLACVSYFKPVLCLQRSAALTVLLRRQGANAEMVIGAQAVPFLSHAWVEIDGRVVNDRSYVTELFKVLERC